MKISKKREIGSLSKIINKQHCNAAALQCENGLRNNKMETLDVFDENGKVTGEKKLKTEIHRDGDWHRSVHIWIINPKQELLIQKRSPKKDTSPNMWDISAGGHANAGESEIKSVIREFEEELGLKLKENYFQYIFTAKQNSRLSDRIYINNEINPVYLVKKSLDFSKIKLQEDEVAEIKWISWQELEEKIKSKNPTYVQYPEEYKKLFEYLRENK